MCFFIFHKWKLHKKFGHKGYDAYICERCKGYGLRWWDYMGTDNIYWYGYSAPVKNQWGETE